MKSLIGSLLVALTVFPTALSKHAIYVNDRADKAIAEIGPAAIASSQKGRHYVYYRLSPWDATVADEVRYRLNKLDGVWTDSSAGPIFVHFK